MPDHGTRRKVDPADRALAARRDFRLSGPRSLALHALCLLLGIPGSWGLLSGMAPRDWPVPLHPQSLGDFALRTVVYFSGVLLFFGGIGLAWAVTRGRGDAPLGGEDRGAASSPAPGHEQDEDLPVGNPTGTFETHVDRRAPTANAEGPVSIAEPLYGYLPDQVQRRFERETGYHALLYTKISILLTSGIGILLAGAWEPAGDAEPIPGAAVARIFAGLYLIAESVQRYLRFTRGTPTGTLVGSLLYGMLPRRRR